MKWRYAITYGKVKPDATFDQIAKDMSKFKADVEKIGVKVVFWGHPFGVSEGLVVVLDVGGDMDNYIKALLGVTTPYTDSRTDFVLEH